MDQRRVGALGLVALVLLVVAFRTTRHREPKATSASAAGMSAPGAPGSYPWPLAAGHAWTYREERRDPSTGRTVESTVTVRVEREEPGGAFRISEREGTHNRASYVLTPKDDGLLISEFQTSTPRQLLPVPLRPGMSWEMGKTARASSRSAEGRPFAGRTLPCVAVDYERFYEADQTEDPGWYPDGTWWISPGLGVVAKDNDKAVRPRLKAGGARSMADSHQRWTLESTTVTSPSSAGP